MNNEEGPSKTEVALQLARKIIDDGWLATGVTQQELDQDEQLMQVFSRLVAEGRNSKDVVAEWEHKTTEEILREYAALVPALHSA